MTILGMDDEKLKIFNVELGKKQKQLELIVTQKKWAAYLGTDQLNIVSGVTTRIAFDTIIHDCEGVGITDNGYQISERGLYLAILRVTWGNIVAANSYWGNLRFTNVNYSAWDIAHASLGHRLSNSISLIGYGVIGDKIQGYVAQLSGLNTPDIEGEKIYTRLDIHLLSRFCF